jgi:hypothetical protein
MALACHEPADQVDVHDVVHQTSAIVRHVVSKALGDIRLRSRHLPRAMVNSPIVATDIVANALTFNMRS